MSGSKGFVKSTPFTGFTVAFQYLKKYYKYERLYVLKMCMKAFNAENNFRRYIDYELSHFFNYLY